MTVTKEQADALRVELERLGRTPPRGVSYARWLEDAVDRNKLSLRIIDVAPELLAEKTVEALATKAVQDAQREVDVYKRQVHGLAGGAPDRRRSAGLGAFGDL